MPEPVGTTLAVIGILKPTFDLCRTLYRSYKIARSFGQDYVWLIREFNFQVARLNVVSGQKVEFIERPINPRDDNDPCVKGINHKLVNIYNQLKRCKESLDKFDSSKENDEHEPEAQPLVHGHDSPNANSIVPKDSSPHKTRRSPRPSQVSQSDGPYSEAHKEEDRSQSGLSHDSTSKLSVKALPERFTKVAHNLREKGHHVKKSVLWIRASKEVTEAIEKIGADIHELERFVKYCPPQSAIPSGELISTIKNLRAVREAARKLHVNLLRVNRCAKGSPLEIAIKIEENPKGVGEELEGSGVAIRNGCFAFPIMIHHERSGEPALSVVAEIDPESTGSTSMPPSVTHAADGLEKINELGRILPWDFKPTDENSYDTLGCIHQPPRSEHVHLFHSTRARYFRRQHLERILGTQDFEDNLSAGKRLQLITLLSHAYVYFARLVNRNKADIRPSSVYFYNKSTESKWDLSSSRAFDPYLSMLFICIGFGEANQKYDPATQSANGRSAPTNSVEELGVLLYQVAGCGKIDYEQELDGLSQAKERARERIHDVDLFACGRISEIISECLNWKPGADLNVEIEMLGEVFCKLERVRREFVSPSI